MVTTPIKLTTLELAIDGSFLQEPDLVTLSATRLQSLYCNLDHTPRRRPHPLNNRPKLAGAQVLKKTVYDDIVIVNICCYFSHKGL